jgi:TM2 domain-containing membrane protein YozV
MYEKHPRKRDKSIRPPQVGPPPAPGADQSTDRPSPPPIPAGGATAEKRVLSAVLAMVLGGFGIHKFYLGYTNEGLIMLLVTVLGGGVGSAVTCGMAIPVAFIMPIIGLIEGVVYLTKTDAEFDAIYVTGRKAWF